MIVLDANILIAYLALDDAHHQSVSAWLQGHDQDEYAASVITVAEALVHPVRARVVATAERSLELLGVTTVGLLQSDHVGLARTRAATGLRMPDAAVVFTAERRGAALATTDTRLAKAARARNLVVHEP